MKWSLEKIASLFLMNAWAKQLVLLFCLVVNMAVLESFGQTVVNSHSYWRINYNYLGATDPRGQATNTNGQTLVVGGATAGEFMLLVDSMGNALWTETLPSGTYSLHDVAQMPNGNFLVVGGTTAAGPSQMNGLWMEVSTNGTILNASTRGDTAYNVITEAKPARYGGYILTGIRSMYNTSGIYLKLDANLQVEWSKVHVWDASGGFQAADSTYWIVQREFSFLHFVHLDKNGVKYEERAMSINATITIPNRLVSTEMDCNGNIYVIASVFEYFAGMNPHPSTLAVYKYNINTNTGLGISRGYSNSGWGPPEYDVYPTDLAFKTNGDLIGVGYINRYANTITSPKREHFVININASSLAVTTTVVGTISTQDRYTSVSILPTGAFLAAGSRDSTFLLHKFTTPTQCNSFSGIAPLQFDTYVTSFIGGPPGAPDYPWGIDAPVAVAPISLAGLGTVACVTNCSTLVTAGFTASVNGNNVTLTSTSTPGAALTWHIPGYSCITGSPVTITLGCGIHTIGLTASNGCSASTYSQQISISGSLANPILMPSLVSDTSVCFMAPVAMVAPPGYTSYLWSNGSTNDSTSILPPDTTHILVQSSANGCYYTDTAIVGLGTSVAVEIGNDTIVCPGVPATFEADSGFTTYAWSNGSTATNITVTVPATYYVTVTLGACMGMDSAILSNYTPSVSIGPNQTVCPSTSVTFNAGPGFNNYLWSNGSTASSITVTSPGTYAVTVTDPNGCTANSSATLSNYPAPSPNLGSNQTVCPGISATFNAGPGFSAYLWSNGSTASNITVTASGTYSVTVTDANGCVSNDSVALSNYPSPSISLGSDTTISTGALLFLSPGIGFTTYLWSNSASSSSITVNQAGTYWVHVTDLNGCSASDTIEVFVATALYNGQQYLLKVWPVPTSDHLRIHTVTDTQDCIRFTLVDLTGKPMWSREIDCQQELNFEVDVQRLAAGTYFLSLNGERGQQVQRIEILR